MLINQLRYSSNILIETENLHLYRRLLDAQMQESIETASLSGVANNNPIVDAILSLLNRDGLDPDSL